MKLNKKQRENLAKFVYDIDKLIFAFLIIGSIISPTGFKSGIFAGGVVSFIVLMISALILDSGGE